MARPFFVLGGDMAKAKIAHPLMTDDKSWNREKVMRHICDQLATSSMGIGRILSKGYEGHNLPSYSTIMLWLTEDTVLSEMYALGKEAQADYMADEMLEIADDGRNDYMEQVGDDDVGGLAFKLNGEHINRSRLRVDTRKWLASKLKPRKYADKVHAEVSGRDGKPIETRDVSMTDVARRVAFMLSAAVAEQEKSNADDKEGKED